MPQNSPHVLVLAYSGRALAEAAKAAGLQTTVLDQFGDADTLLAADRYVPVDFTADFTTPFQAINELASNTVRLPVDKIGLKSRYHTNSGTEPLSAVILGGGCENRPTLVKQLHLLARKGSLAGIPSQAAIRKLRKVEFWQGASADAGCHFPPTKPASKASFDASTSLARQDWLQKQADSAGGLGVRRLRQANPTAESFAPGSYLQKQIEGRSLGISIVVGDQATRVLGCTESISSRDWQPAKEHKAAPSSPGSTVCAAEFVYRGSWGPIRLPDPHLNTLARIGDYCRTNTDWRGWLQIDFIEDRWGRLWLLEMNPRWTAGMEVLRLSGVCNPVEAHLHALENAPQESPTLALAPDKLVMKAVYYAEQDITSDLLNVAANESEQELAASSTSTERIFRDIPSLSSASVLAGHPALTLVVTQPMHANVPQDASRQKLFDALRHARKTLESKLHSK